MSKIILTDDPKLNYQKYIGRIPANLPGMSAEELIDLRDQTFHLMLPTADIYAGGYVMHLTIEQIDEELKRRGEWIPVK
jgi:hypothetical protein